MTFKKTVISAFNTAFYHRHYRTGIPILWLVFQCGSDSKYTCNSFVALLKKYNITQSKSGKGDCWDNTVAESFFKTLKSELIYRLPILSTETIKAKVFYSRERRHSAMQNMTITEFWEKYNEIKKIFNCIVT